jgi:hypothetical protein
LKEIPPGTWQHRGGYIEHSLHKICDFAIENLTTENINDKLLLATNNEGNTAWHLAARKGESVTVQQI